MAFTSRHCFCTVPYPGYSTLRSPVKQVKSPTKQGKSLDEILQEPRALGSETIRSKPKMSNNQPSFHVLLVGIVPRVGAVTRDANSVKVWVFGGVSVSLRFGPKSAKGS
eukprot:1837519-Amphidinium_carterae.1